MDSSSSSSSSLQPLSRRPTPCPLVTDQTCRTISLLFLSAHYDWAQEHLTATRQRQLNGSSSSPLLVDFGISFSSGMIAEAIACIIYFPVDVIKERLQTQHGTDRMAYAGSADSIRTIARTEGILALYEGYGATLLSFGTYSGFFFLFYEQLVAHVKRQQQDTQQAIPFYWTLACSATAGSLASWLTSPLIGSCTVSS